MYKPVNQNGLAGFFFFVGMIPAIDIYYANLCEEYARYDLIKEDELITLTNE